MHMIVIGVHDKKKGQAKTLKGLRKKNGYRLGGEKAHNLSNLDDRTHNSASNEMTTKYINDLDDRTHN